MVPASYKLEFFQHRTRLSRDRVQGSIFNLQNSSLATATMAISSGTRVLWTWVSWGTWFPQTRVPY